MAEGEASCAAEWATFVQQNISNAVVANVTAGDDRLQLLMLLSVTRHLLPSCCLMIATLIPAMQAVVCQTHHCPKCCCMDTE